MGRINFVIILGLSILFLNGCEKNVLDTAYTDKFSENMDDLVYYSHTDACVMKAGSIWTLTMDKDKDDYDKMNVYMENRENGKVVEIAQYDKQNYIEYTVPEDGIYVVYLASGQASGDVVDVTDELDVSYASGGREEGEFGVVPIQ